MAMKLIMTVFILPVMLVMYGVTLGLDKENRGMLFAVTLWKGAADQEEIKALKKSYKRSEHIILVLLSLSMLLILLPRHFSIFITLWLIWMFAAIIVPLLPFIKANRRMMELKRAHCASLREPDQKQEDTVYVDLSVAGAEKKDFFKWSTRAALLAALLPAVIQAVLYRYWSSPEAPELWVSEVVLLSVASVALMCDLFLFYWKRMAARPLTVNSPLNVQFARVKQYQWSRLCCILAWATAGYNWWLMAVFHFSTQVIFWGTMCGMAVYTGVLLTAAYIAWKNIQKMQEKYISRERILMEDDDEKWIWGMFYYNKNDSRLMVEKRAGIGWTTNMAKPSAKILTYGVGGITVIIMIAMCSWTIALDFTPVSLEYENGVLTASHLGEEYSLKKAEIQSVELLEEKPRMSKRYGTAMDSVDKGSFFSREYDHGFQVCMNPQAPPFLLVKGKDGTWYLLGDQDGGRNREIYWEIQEELRE